MAPSNKASSTTKNLIYKVKDEYVKVRNPANSRAPKREPRHRTVIKAYNDIKAAKAVMSSQKLNSVKVDQHAIEETEVPSQVLLKSVEVDQLKSMDLVKHNGKRFSIVFKDSKNIDGFRVVPKVGITLTAKQWRKLCESAHDINGRLTNKAAVLPYVAILDEPNRKVKVELYKEIKYVKVADFYVDDSSTERPTRTCILFDSKSWSVVAEHMVEINDLMISTRV